MNEQTHPLRWGIEKRLEFIEFRLFWEGAINRADLVDQFGVSVPQASNDLSRYQEIAPKNVLYDKSAKRYVRSPNFKPVLRAPSADRYLAQLQNLATETTPASDSWLSSLPPVDVMPVPHRTVSVTVLRSVLEAITETASLEIEYQSMGKARPEPTRRWVTPHAFGNDGFRWHVRAYCHIDDKFKDFLLSRFLQIHGFGEPGASSQDDRFWKEHLQVVLIPNPALTKAQRQIIAMDYGMREHSVKLPVRKALLYYFKKRFRLDVAVALDPPEEAPVVVKNRAEFDAALAEASA